MWQNAHLANFNTKDNPIKQRKAAQAEIIGLYPSRVIECPFAKLSYSLSKRGDIMIKIKFPKTGRIFEYDPIESTTLKRQYLYELEDANEAEGMFALKSSGKRASKKAKAKAIITATSKSQEQYDPSLPSAEIEDRLKIRKEIAELKSKLERQILADGRRQRIGI